MLKKSLSFSLMLGLILCLFSCNNVSKESNVEQEVTNEVLEDTLSADGGQIYKIGTLQLVQHESLDESYQGFIDYLEEEGIQYTMDYQNASGEQSNCQIISNKFMNEDLDLIYAIATPAAQSVLAVDNDIPIIGCAITDYASSGLCDTNERPGGLITGASDLTPIDAQFDLITELLPDAKRIGLFYCNTEANSKIQIDMARQSAEKRNLSVVEYTITNSNDIQTVMESMIGNIDCIYIPTDNTLASGMDVVGTIARDNNLPVIPGAIGMCNAGGYATYGIDYYQLGRIAGRMAKEVLVDGKETKDMPIEYLSANLCQRVINKEFASALGLRLE